MSSKKKNTKNSKKKNKKTKKKKQTEKKVQTITVYSKCSCGNGDAEHSQKNSFENKCLTCGKEGTLYTDTLDNVEVKPDEGQTNNNDSETDDTVPKKLVCKNCGAEYCGQDGYDLYGGNRAGLHAINPHDISTDYDEVSTTEEDTTTYMSGWEGLCDLLRPLDAEAMIVQRGDYVIVRRIDMPQTAKLWAYEGINVVDDSVTITDYTPEIYNTFVIKWGESFENELEFVFEDHKRLFGERRSILEATKPQVVSEDSEEGDDKNKDKKKNEDDGGLFKGVTDLIFGSDNDKKKNDDKKSDDKNSLTGEDEEKPETEDVPITTKEEAMQFGMKQIGKAKRDDGHTIELKVIGNQNWMMGEWCHVKLPSFHEDCYMFISKCSFETSPENEYINSLTLVDYPPTLGKPFSNSSEEDSSKEEEENSENSENGEGTDGTNGSENNSNGNNNNSNTNSTGS